jgi:3-oxoacyl-[acyl-carrier-protein] synthase I
MTVMYLGPVGMVCSVGLSASSACAAMRAGIAKFDDLPYNDKAGNPVVGAFVPGIDFTLPRGRRLVEMLILALADCLDNSSATPWHKVPMLVGLAETGRPAGGAGLAERIVAQVQDAMGLKFHPTLSRGIARGHTAGFEALRAAEEILSNTDVPGCLVCGVDSYINASSLLWLRHQWRLKSEEHSDGVIPGEGASIVFVERKPSAKSQSPVAVSGLGFGQEKATVTSEEPLSSIGLAAAARAALAEARVQMHEVDFRLSDVTGEYYGFKEQSLALSRLLRVRRETLPLWHNSDCIGDTGAAAGLGLVIRACHSFQGSYAPGRRAACYTSAVGGDRAVAVVELRSE